MPTYQYACTACGHRFEAVQAFTDASLSDCPECSGRLRKVYGSVGVVFKGSGFYRTDSRAEAKSKATASAGTESSSTSSTSSKSESATSSTSSKSESGKSSSNSTSSTSSTSTTTAKAS